MTSTPGAATQTPVKYWGDYGSMAKTVYTDDDGVLDIETPRDLDGSFEPLARFR